MATDLSRLLGANIKAFRKSRELTQERLAALAGISTPYLALLEGGKKFPSEDKLAMIALALQVRPFELFLDPLVDSVRSDLVSSAVSEDFIKELTSVVQKFTQEYRASHLPK